MEEEQKPEERENCVYCEKDYPKSQRDAHVSSHIDGDTIRSLARAIIALEPFERGRLLHLFDELGNFKLGR